MGGGLQTCRKLIDDGAIDAVEVHRVDRHRFQSFRR